MNKLFGRTEIEDALKRLDKLTQEEARMAAVQNLKVTHTLDERVKGVADTVVAIDNRVAGVDDRVQRTANNVDEVKRMSSPDFINADYETSPNFQGTKCGKAFTNGSPHQIPRQTTILHVVLITRKKHLGFFKAVSIRTGNQQDPFFGYTENVCPLLFST